MNDKPNIPQNNKRLKLKIKLGALVLGMFGLFGIGSCADGPANKNNGKDNNSSDTASADTSGKVSPEPDGTVISCYAPRLDTSFEK